MKQSVSVIGSTGSIGVNTLKVVAHHKDRFRVAALAAGGNIELLAEQVREFKPRIVSVKDREKAELLKRRLNGTRTRIVYGEDGILEASAGPGVDTVVFSVVGAKGLKPLIAAAREGKRIAFANKEPFVIAGELIKKIARKHGAELIPVDSEHSAIFQCLEGKKMGQVRRIILTSSGGPFLKIKAADLKKVTVEMALRHPRWKMGAKITIDSATLMNKGLEVIEAAHLFDLPAGKIDVLIHPEAIIHSMVEFVDGSHLAQLAVTDMRIPIQYAMTYPDRWDSNGLPRLSLSDLEKLTFRPPDPAKFPCLRLGYEAQRAGGTMPAVLNAANEVAVEKFLNREIGFTDIPKKIEKVMRAHRAVKSPGLGEILAADAWARRKFE